MSECNKLYELKCTLLKQHCDEIQAKNNARISQISQIHKITERLKKKRLCLLKRLQSHGDKIHAARKRFALGDQNDPVEISHCDASQ